MDLRTFELSKDMSIQVLTHRQILGFGVNIIQKNKKKLWKNEIKLKLTLGEFRKLKDILPKCYRMMLHFNQRKKMGKHHNLPPSQQFVLSKYRVVTLVPFLGEIVMRICPMDPPKEVKIEPKIHYYRCITFETKLVGKFHRMWAAVNRHISCQFVSTIKIIKLDSPMALKQAQEFIKRFYWDGQGYARLVLQKSFVGKPYRPGSGITLPQSHVLKIPKLEVVQNELPKMQKVGHAEWSEVAMETNREKASIRPYSLTALSMYPTCGGGVGCDGVEEETEKSIRREFETLRLNGVRGDVDVKETCYKLTKKGATMEMDEQRRWFPRGVLKFNETGVEPSNIESSDDEEECALTEEEEIFSDDQQETANYNFGSWSRNKYGVWEKVDEKEKEEKKKEEKTKKGEEKLECEFDKERELIFQSSDESSNNSSDKSSDESNDESSDESSDESNDAVN